MRLFLALVFLSSPVLAKDLTITLTDADQQAEIAALDAYVKAGGINVATAAVILLQKMQAAAQAPELPKPGDAK